MKFAEELYQAGFISYPRTETDSFPPGMDLMVQQFLMQSLHLFSSCPYFKLPLFRRANAARLQCLVAICVVLKIRTQTYASACAKHALM